MRETVGYGKETERLIKENGDKKAYKDSALKLSKAEATIVDLLRNSAAFQKTIDRLTDAWGDRKEEAMESAQAMLDEATREAQEDITFMAKSKGWARSRVDINNNRPVGGPKIRPRKPKP